nr:MAG TPA: hypothetical protein [Caudoviricetes sp.]
MFPSPGKQCLPAPGKGASLPAVRSFSGRWPRLQPVGRVELGTSEPVGLASEREAAGVVQDAVKC